MKRATQIISLAFRLLPLLTLYSCLDHQDDLRSQHCQGPCATVSGRITTYDGTQPLSGVVVTATWIHTFYLGGGTIRTKANTRTDNSGNYTLKFEVRADELVDGYFQFDVLTSKEYFRCGNPDEYPSFSAYRINNDSILTQDLFIPYTAHLKVKAIGAEKMSNSDYFSVTITPDVNITSNACGSVMGWNNQSPNWIYRIDIPARLNLVVETVINKGQGYERSYDTLFLGKGQTMDYTAVFK